MLFTIRELIDLVIMVFAIGYIFSTFVKKRPHEGYDPLTYYGKSSFWEDLKHGIIVAAPAIVLHELSHKFVAMAFGIEATLHAPITWYIIVIIMRLLNFPFLFFVGGYVSHAALPPLESFIVSISGPMMNLFLYLMLLGVIRFKLVKRKHYDLVIMAGRLNLFLFLFNLIPLPGFDGYSAIVNLIKLFF